MITRRGYRYSVILCIFFSIASAVADKGKTPRLALLKAAVAYRLNAVGNCKLFKEITVIEAVCTDTLDSLGDSKLGQCLAVFISPYRIVLTEGVGIKVFKADTAPGGNILYVYLKILFAVSECVPARTDEGCGNIDFIQSIHTRKSNAAYTSERLWQNHLCDVDPVAEGSLRNSESSLLNGDLSADIGICIYKIFTDVINFIFFGHTLCSVKGKKAYLKNRAAHIYRAEILTVLKSIVVDILHRIRYSYRGKSDTGVKSKAADSYDRIGDLYSCKLCTVPEGTVSNTGSSLFYRKGTAYIVLDLNKVIIYIQSIACPLCRNIVICSLNKAVTESHNTLWKGYGINIGTVMESVFTDLLHRAAHSDRLHLKAVVKGIVAYTPYVFAYTDACYF